MTNDAFAQGALRLAETNAMMDFTVFTHEPISLPDIAWRSAMALMPLSSIIIFIHGINARRIGCENFWQPRLLVLASVVTMTTTLIAVSTSLQDAFFCTATQPGGAAQEAMLRISIAHAWGIVRAGVMASALSLALALLTPSGKSR